MITTIPLTLFLIWAAATASSASPLAPDFYLSSCPSALPTIQAAVRAAVQEEPRMGASLLRLHFHDCFVQGCDGSVLLRDRDNFKGEQTAPPNINSIRGLEVIDTIKSQLEKICPGNSHIGEFKSRNIVYKMLLFFPSIFLFFFGSNYGL